MEQQIKREVATQTATAGEASAPRKREVAAAPSRAGLSTQDLILIAVLLAAGAVLKLTVGSLLSSMGMKPNFIIAMYCLAIILTRPKLGQALVIGLLAGLICQIPLLNATPLLNIPSEVLGALACGLLIKVPLRIGGKLDLNPLVNTFVSTVVSGGTFALLSVYINVVSTGGDVMVALATYAAIVFGTATFNCILVQVLAMPLKKVLKRWGFAVLRTAKQPASLTHYANLRPQKDSFMIKIRDFTFRYREGDRPVVSGIDLDIPDGAFVGITGAAGSGKSTLTYALNGIIPHCYPGDFYGSVVVDGLDTCEVALTDVSRLVGSVCQDVDSQFVTSVVEDEILYGLENFGVPRGQIEDRVAQALADMGIADLRDRVISSLSGGQKQKVAIASVLALNPRVLVLDEPTAELDPLSSRTVFDLLARYAREHGATVVVVEQKIALLSQYADMLVVVDEGRIRFADAPAQVLEHSDELKAIGVNCPRSTTLMNRLRAEGLYAGAPVRNVREAREALKEVLA